MPDANTKRIPADELEVILAKSRMTEDTKAIARLCLVKGMSYNAVATLTGRSRQSVHQTCTRVYAKWQS